MKTINRYILWELICTFVFALIALTSLLIVGGLIKEAVSNGIPMTHVVRLVPYVVVEMSRISLPMTLLLAVTVFFAKMSGNNEIIALKSLGIAPWAVLWPVMLLGLIVSVFAVWLNEMAVTWGQPGINTVIYRAAEDILLEQLRTNHRFESPDRDFTIMVKGVENRRLVSPMITTKKPVMTIEAQFAQLKIDYAAQQLIISLVNSKVKAEGGTEYGGDRTINVPLPQIIKDTTSYTRPSNMGFQTLADEASKSEEALMKNRRFIAAKRAFSTCMGSVDAWAANEIKQIQSQSNYHEKRLERLSAEPPRRWATGFSCFFFIWMGAPLAIWLRKSDIFSSFFACFIPVLLFYYPLLMFGMEGAKKGNLPPESVWIANICLGIVGLHYMRKIHRY